MTYKFPGAPAAPFPIGAVEFRPLAPQNTWLGNDDLQCVDSPLFSFSFWIKLRNAAGPLDFWVVDPNDGSTFAMFQGGALAMALCSTGGENMLEIEASEPMSQGEWHHVMGSAKTDVEDGIAAVYIDGVRADVAVTLSGDTFTIAMSGLEFKLGGDEWDLAEFWLAMGQSLLDEDGDIPEATRRKFIDHAGWPVDLGEDGETPTGTAPTIFMRCAAGADSTTFLDNLGTGGAFTTGHGGVWEALTSPTDVPEPFVNPMTAANDLIRGGTAGYPARLAGPASEGTFTLKSVDGVLTWVEDA